MNEESFILKVAPFSPEAIAYIKILIELAVQRQHFD